MVNNQPYSKSVTKKSVKLPADLHQRLRLLAAETGQTMESHLYAALRFYLAARGNPELLGAHDKSEGDE